MSSETMSRSDDTYAMGRTEAETRCLIRQGEFQRLFTQRFLTTAGLKPGMRVLDVGSGAGVVALLAGELVGSYGSVLGTDVNPAVLAVTRARTQEAGYNLFQHFRNAGLPTPQMELAAGLGGGPDWSGYDYTAETLRSILPLLLKFGLATAEEVDIDTFADRLRAETLASGGVVKAPDLVGAWVRID